VAWPEAGRVGLAVSGGPDSLALMLLASAALTEPIAVATVDHGLRPESGAEAEIVSRLCADRGMQHLTLRLDLKPGAGLQERAREARYLALGAWAQTAGLAAIATAHHADDQAETLLMRLSRGAGVRGLAAMRRRSSVPGLPECALLRPLLGWRRSELAKIVAEADITPVCDPSNSDTRFERARLRANLGNIPGLDLLAVATSAHHLAEADAAIEWASGRSLATANTQSGTLFWTPGDTPRAVVLRVLERIVAQLGGKAPRGTALARWHALLANGKIATLGGVRGDGRLAEWRFRPAPAPRGTP